MQKNSENFSMQDALRLAETPAGQQLLALLQQTDSSALQLALEQAEAGNYANVQKALTDLMKNKEVRSLLKQLGG